MRDKRPALPISGAPHATLRNPGVAWENRRTPPGLSHKVGPAQPGGAPPLEGPGATPLPAARESVRGGAPCGAIAPHLLLGAVRVWDHRVSLTRFRCSAHDLRVERDRHLPQAVRPPRHLRTCMFCCSSSVEDESHMVFHCPLYESLRFEFADLFSADRNNLATFLDQNPDRVANFVHSCFDLRSQVAHMSLAGSGKAHM